MLRTLCQPSLFRTLVYTKSETEIYSDLCQTSTMERFAKVVSDYICFHKLKLFLQYQLFTFSSFFNESLFFTPEVYLKAKRKRKKKEDISKNMPRCHFLLIVIVIAIMLIYKHCVKSVRIRSYSGAHFLSFGLST